MPVIGTAGHVDHGKSTLVEALSGRHPDRWEEEKRRGLTIDLGFAWATLPDGAEVSFVDVPGHERFIKNMLAGIEAIDVALMVVAADEGWAAQSEEHLAVLDLLEVGHGVIAVTKTDRVDPPLAELVALEATEKLAGTSLAGSAVVAVSAATGQGMENLIDQLTKAVAASARSGSGRSRMWIDRSFTISGAGTVVTGTLLEGPLSVDDRVELWPGQAQSRIRSLQSHERSFDTVEANRRVAVNLAGVERSAIGRGSMLGRPGQWRATRRAAVTVRSARYVENLGERGAYHLHLGSGAWPVRLRFMETDLAIIQLPVPLCLEVGDRFIIRETGRRAVVGGGRVIDPTPPADSRAVRAAAPVLRPMAEGTPDQRAQALLDLRGSSPVEDLAAHSGGGSAKGAVTIDGVAYATRLWSELGIRLAGEIGDFHLRHPLRAGLAASTIASKWQTGAAVVEAVALDHPDLSVDQGVISAASHRLDRDAQQEERWKETRKRLLQAGLSVPRITELGLGGDLLHSLIRDGLLVRVSDEFVYLPEQVEAMVGLAGKMPAAFTVSDFKEAAGVSRKYAVPFLEWADKNGFTRRDGDLRTAREGPEPAV